MLSNLKRSLLSACFRLESTDTWWTVYSLHFFQLLQHPHLCGTHGRACTVPQPQDLCGHGPFPVGKGSTKPLLRFQSLVMVLREEDGVCLDQLLLQCELTALKKKGCFASPMTKNAEFCAQIPLPKSSISILAISGSPHAVKTHSYGKAAEDHPSISLLLTSSGGN